MTLPAQDIVERLHSHRQAFGVHYEQREVEVCIEAADTISRLTADNEALGSALEAERAAMDVTQCRAIAAESRVTALEAALLAIRETYCHSRGTWLPVIAQIDDVVSAALGGSDHG